jgi:hypothetical protein
MTAGINEANEFGRLTGWVSPMLGCHPYIQQSVEVFRRYVERTDDCVALERAMIPLHDSLRKEHVYFELQS